MENAMLSLDEKIDIKDVCILVSVIGEEFSASKNYRGGLPKNFAEDILQKVAEKVYEEDDEAEDLARGGLQLVIMAMETKKLES